MSSIYILQSQDDLFLSKSGEWVSGDDSKILFRTQHKDEAINQKVELTVKQPELRVNISTAQLSDNGKLILSKEPQVVLPECVTPAQKTETVVEHKKDTAENVHIHSTDTASPTQQPVEQSMTPQDITN